MKTKIQLIVLSLLALQAGCASDPRNANQMAFEDALMFQEEELNRFFEAQLEIKDLDEAQIRERLVESLSDVTAIIKQTGHGIYVEYTSADGRLYMWYPGNGGVVGGTWGISDNFSPPRACFKYRASYHGVTGEYEPNECVDTEQTIGDVYVVDKREGDVFGLSTSGIPYVKSAGNLPPWPEDWEQFESQ